MPLSGIYIWGLRKDMGRKKIGVINIDNCDNFVYYIKARTKTLTDELVFKLVELIHLNKKMFHQSKFEFEKTHGVEKGKLETLNNKDEKLIAEINEAAFHESNTLIESLNGLKKAFKNAEYQARYKKKNKLTDNERFILEFNTDEYLYLKMLKELCKKKGINLEDELQDLYCAMSERDN